MNKSTPRDTSLWCADLTNQFAIDVAFTLYVYRHEKGIALSVAESIAIIKRRWECYGLNDMFLDVLGRYMEQYKNQIEAELRSKIHNAWNLTFALTAVTYDGSIATDAYGYGIEDRVVLSYIRDQATGNFYRMQDE